MQLFGKDWVVTTGNSVNTRKGNTMNWKQSLKRFGSWLVKGAAVLTIPAMLPSSVGVGERFGLVGALLIWLYMGRQMDRNRQVEPKID